MLFIFSSVASLPYYAWQRSFKQLIYKLGLLLCNCQLKRKGPGLKGGGIVEFFLNFEKISMAWCKTAVTPLLMHWSYCSLALSHRCMVEMKYLLKRECPVMKISPKMMMTLLCPCVFHMMKPRLWWNICALLNWLRVIVEGAQWPLSRP